jgi:hypothetical protein
MMRKKGQGLCPPPCLPSKLPVQGGTPWRGPGAEPLAFLLPPGGGARRPPPPLPPASRRAAKLLAQYLRGDFGDGATL